VSVENGAKLTGRMASIPNEISVRADKTLSSDSVEDGQRTGATSDRVEPDGKARLRNPVSKVLADKK
jgi:hypothetical protein